MVQHKGGSVVSEEASMVSGSSEHGWGAPATVGRERSGLDAQSEVSGTQVTGHTYETQQSRYWKGSNAANLFGRARGRGRDGDDDNKSVVSSTASNRPVTAKRRGKVKIKRPKALTGSSYLVVFCTGVHYMGLSFLCVAGGYFNDDPPPFMLFIIPSFAAGAVTVVGALFLVLQYTWLVRKLCEPSTGLKLSILGTFGCAVWSLVIYGPLKNDYTQAVELFEIGGVMLIYFLLVRRRLNFASIAYSEGAKAVCRLKALWFRIIIHGIYLAIYASGWSIVYLQQLRIPVTSDPSLNSTNSTNTTDIFANATALDTQGAKADYLNSGARYLPSWIASQIRQGTIRSVAKVFLIYNLIVVTQVIKASIWLSTAASCTSISTAARKSGAVRLRTREQLNTMVRDSYPSLALASHLSLLAGVLHALAEGFRRCRGVRKGILFNIGALLATLTKPLVTRVNSYGLCDMGTVMDERNLLIASRQAWDDFDKVGLDHVVNADVLFGVRICSNLLFASACSVLGRLLVEFFGFPNVITLEIGMMCFIIAFLIGNIGIEAGEAWAVSLLVHYARSPESVYVANPNLANALHFVLFGLPMQNTHRKHSKGGDHRVGDGQLDTVGEKGDDNSEYAAAQSLGPPTISLGNLRNSESVMFSLQRGDSIRVIDGIGRSVRASDENSPPQVPKDMRRPKPRFAKHNTGLPVPKSLGDDAGWSHQGAEWAIEKEGEASGSQGSGKANDGEEGEEEGSPKGWRQQEKVHEAGGLVKWIGWRRDSGQAAEGAATKGLAGSGSGGIDSGQSEQPSSSRRGSESESHRRGSEIESSGSRKPLRPKMRGSLMGPTSPELRKQGTLGKGLLGKQGTVSNFFEPNIGAPIEGRIVATEELADAAAGIVPPSTIGLQGLRLRKQGTLGTGVLGKQGTTGNFFEPDVGAPIEEGVGGSEELADAAAGIVPPSTIGLQGGSPMLKGGSPMLKGGSPMLKGGSPMLKGGSPLSPQGGSDKSPKGSRKDELAKKIGDWMTSVDVSPRARESYD